MGFEPTRAEHNGLAVHRLNHSATLSFLLNKYFSMDFDQIPIILKSSHVCISFFCVICLFGDAETNLLPVLAGYTSIEITDAILSVYSMLLWHVSCEKQFQCLSLFSQAVISYDVYRVRAERFNSCVNTENYDNAIISSFQESVFAYEQFRGLGPYSWPMLILVNKKNCGLPITKSVKNYVP